MLILGLDPGLAETGWGIIETKSQKFAYIAHGCIRTQSNLTLGARLHAIYTELSTLIDLYKPEEASIESLFFSKNVSSALPVAHARGCLILTSTIHSLGIFEYTPLVIKQSLVGVGRAEKGQVGAMVKFFLGLPEIPKPDHAADALAAAITHAHHRRV